MAGEDEDGERADWKRGEWQCQAEAADSSWWILKEVQEKHKTQEETPATSYWTDKAMTGTSRWEDRVLIQQWMSWLEAGVEIAQVLQRREATPTPNTRTHNLGREETQGRTLELNPNLHSLDLWTETSQAL